MEIVEHLDLGTPAGTSVQIGTQYISVKDSPYLAIGLGGNDATAIQAALDAAGTLASADTPQLVYFPPGIYGVTGGLTIPSYVSLAGPGSLKHLDPGSNTDLLATKIVGTGGTIAAGSDTVTVASVADVHIGALCTIRGAGITDPLQQSTITAGLPVGIGDTTINVTSLANCGSGAFLCGTEIIYGTVSGNTLINCTRGAYGTTAATHAAGVTIAPILVARGIVTAINSGTKQVTLVDALNPGTAFSAVRAVTDPGSGGAPRPEVDFGAVGVHVAVDIDGNRAAGTSSAKCVGFLRASRCSYVGTVVNGTFAGLFLDGAVDCRADVTLVDCGNGALGAAAWAYRCAYRNTVRINGYQSTAANGVMFDDRTVQSSELDGLPQYNDFFGVLSGKASLGGTAVVFNASRNSWRGIVRAFALPYQFASSVQSVDGATTLGCAGNYFGGVIDACTSAGLFDSNAATTNNVLAPSASDIKTVTGDVTAITNGNTIARWGNQALTVDGLVGSPAHSFLSDTDTGIYRIGADDLGLAIGGARLIRLRANEFGISNGVNVDIGTTTGTKFGLGISAKLGFWGATPVVQPSAMTQTYSTADATLGAYTSDPESSAYTGAADSEAKLADLNALRVAYENLRVFTEDLAAFTNSLVDKLQSIGIVG